MNNKIVFTANQITNPLSISNLYRVPKATCTRKLLLFGVVSNEIMWCNLKIYLQRLKFIDKLDDSLTVTKMY